MKDFFHEAEVQLASLANPQANGLFSLDQVKQIVNSMPMAVSITDQLGTILYINEHFSTVTGYSAQELIGQNHAIISYRTTPVSVYEQLWKTITSNKPWTGRLVNRRKNGERYLADIRISPLKDPNSSVGNYYLGVHRDISDSHARLTQHSNHENMISAVLNTVPTAVALLNEDKQVILDNLTYKTLATDLNSEPATLVIQKLKADNNFSTNGGWQESLFANRNIIVDFEQHGQKRFFSCRLLNLEMLEEDIDSYYKPQTAAHTVMMLTEVTREHRQMQKQRLTELQRSTTETEMMHAMQETMHAVLHQLQEPVNMIESACNMLCKKDMGCSGIQPMNMALDAGKAALTQLREALPERPVEARQSVNLNQLIHELAEMSSDRLLKRSIELRLVLVANLSTLTAQPSRLRVALKQLLDNAIDAIDFGKCEHREIQISTRQIEDDLLVLVEDSGPGIAKSDALKVFQPFYTTKPVTSEGSRGIGLSVVQQVMNEHCGTVKFTDSSLGGCCARVTLPKRQEV